MNTQTNYEQDNAQNILAALREIHDTPGLQAEAIAKPESTMNRLGLSGVARHAVAFALAVAIVGPAAAHAVTPDGFWQ
jgi:hypothetical protein